MKNNGAVSTAGQTVKKGNKGRLSLYAERTEDGLQLHFQDFGNYGRERWSAMFPMTDSDLENMVFLLDQLRLGEINTTLAEPAETQEEVTETTEAEPAEATPEEIEEPYAAEANDTVEDIEQLSM